MSDRLQSIRDTSIGATIAIAGTLCSSVALILIKLLRTPVSIVFSVFLPFLVRTSLSLSPFCGGAEIQAHQLAGVGSCSYTIYIERRFNVCCMYVEFSSSLSLSLFSLLVLSNEVVSSWLCSALYRCPAFIH